MNRLFIILMLGFRLVYANCETFYKAQQYESAYTECLKSAESNIPEAQINLGWMYYEGKGVKKDYSQTFYWFLQASNQGNVNAQHNLGRLYYKGEGVQQDYTQSYNWYLKAAKQSNANAQYMLGVMYYKGEGVQQDYTQSYNWYLKSADQGNANAQYRLGLMYYKGEGVKKDYTQACALISKAAVQSDDKTKSLKKYICAISKKPLESKTDCLKKISYKIEHDDLNLGYKLDQGGRNYYYLYGIGYCQAVDDYNKGINARDQASFHNAAFPKSKEKPIQHNLLGEIYTSKEFTIAWKAYIQNYTKLMLIGEKVYK